MPAANIEIPAFVTIFSNVATLRLSGHLIGGGAWASTLQVYGALELTDGSLLQITVRTLGTTKFASTISDDLLNSHLELAGGPATWEAGAGNIKLQDSQITNKGLFNIHNGSSIEETVGMGPSLFSNTTTGEVFSVGGVHHTVIETQFSTAGKLSVNGAMFTFNRGLVQYDNGSQTTLNGGVIEPGPLYDLQAGTLLGTGIIDGNLTAHANAIVDLGATVGTLLIGGNYTQKDGAELKIKIGGNGAGQYDVLDIGGTATLDGKLTVTLVNGFTPGAADTFVVLTSQGARMGTFDVVTAGWTATYNPNDVTLGIPGGGPIGEEPPPP